MDNLIKIPSNQSSFDVGAGATKGLVDIMLPQGSVYNLNESFININCSVVSVCTADANGVYNNFVTFNGQGDDSHAYPNPVVVIKHAHARGQKVGKIEDLRNVNLLRHNLDLYKTNLSEANDDINGLMSNNIRSVYKPQPVNELYGFGGNDGGISRNRDHDIRIPLRDIFNFCRTESYDSNKYGALHIHLELDNTRMGVGVETINNFTTLGKFGVGADLFQNMEVIEAGGVVGAGGSTKLRTANEYRDMNDGAFYTGQPVICNRVKDGAGATNSGTLRIIDIAFDDATPSNKLVLTLSGAWTDGAGTYTLPKLSIDTTRSSNTLTINSIESAVVVNNSDKGGSLNYSTFSSQEDTYDATATTYNNNYEIPANTKNIYIMFNSGGNVVSGVTTNLDKYRLTLDGEEVTNRAVKVRSPLHYELINQVFLNNGEAVHNLGEKLYNIFNSKARGGITTQTNFIIAVPCRFLPRPQRLGIDFDGNAGALGGRHIIYSEVVKSL